MERRERLLQGLPVRTQEETIRCWRRADMDELAAWPEYGYPYAGFEFSFQRASALERDEVFRERLSDPRRITLVAEDAGGELIAYAALLNLDGRRAEAGSFSYRVRADACDHGVGTRILRRIVEWAFAGGLRSIVLDVAASNGRAVRCYEKVGFVDVGEVWRPLTLPVAPGRAGDSPADLDAAEYAFLRPHVRLHEGQLEQRFRLMATRRPR